MNSVDILFIFLRTLVIAIPMGFLAGIMLSTKK